ncbi:MAG: hypothetical protein CFE21_07015 [Bacteroidetes bacterium B1(2017)]|nr:MAG: hypothetical protein CFE21_07015 [Bacteroidetes bacterium B1(2017)]
MRKLFLLLSFFVSSLSYAQRFDEPNYGLSLNGNFTTVHVAHENLVGRGMGSFGVFYQRAITPYHTNRYLNRLDFTLEPALSWLSYRDNTSDKRFQSNFIDFSAYLNYVPDRMSDDLRLFIGARPSYLTFSNTQVVEFGSYRELTNDSQNANTIGAIDFSGIIGLTVSMGDVASLELKYIHSFTNKTTATTFNGRPSCVEIGIRLSAVRIKNKMITEEKSIVAELNKRAQGTLLVMLEAPNEKLINQLITEKRIEDANYVRKLQFQTNKNIMKEFAANFDFCKVEFFMNTDAYKVDRGDFKGVFLDQNLEPKAEVSFDSSNYFIASFIEDVSEYTHKSDYGLYMYDTKFNQLGKPYNTSANSMGIFIGGDPLNYFRRIKTSGYFSDDFAKVIKKVNTKLQLGRIPINQ